MRRRLRLGFAVIAVLVLGLAAAGRLGAVVNKLAGDRGPRLITLTGASLKGVVYGLVGTAFAQGSLANMGFWLAGVPGAFLLGVLTAFLSVIPMGPVLLWLPAAVWPFFQMGATGPFSWWCGASSSSVASRT